MTPVPRSLSEDVVQVLVPGTVLVLYYQVVPVPGASTGSHRGRADEFWFFGTLSGIFFARANSNIWNYSLRPQQQHARLGHRVSTFSRECGGRNRLDTARRARGVGRDGRAKRHVARLMQKERRGYGSQVPRGEKGPRPLFSRGAHL